MTAEQETLRLHLQTACIWEVLARKAGNVHRYRDFTDTSLCDFLLCAAACAGPLSRLETPLGSRIHQAVLICRQVCRSNANLGIILLLAPLAELDYGGNWQQQLETVIESADVKDTHHVYAAIRLANPAGLGQLGEADIRTEPTLRLREAMALAADRDLVARQYATAFADVRDFGLPLLETAWRRWRCVEAAVLECQLHWLAHFEDSLIARKNGLEVARWVQRQAQEILRHGGLETVGGRQAYAQLDEKLRTPDNRLNPGTIADLIAAALFVSLRTGLLSPASPFRWELDAISGIPSV